MAKSYNTGGVVKPSHSSAGEGAQECSIEAGSIGTSDGPNARKNAQSPNK